MREAACPYCQRQVPVDGAGNSACGHLRSASPPPVPTWQPAPPPVQPAWGQPAPPPVQPAWGQPSPPAWGQPQPVKRGHGCAKGCGCAGIVVVLLLIALAAIGIFMGDSAFRFGDNATYVADPATPLTGTIELGATVSAGSETSEPGSDTTLTASDDSPIAGTRIVIAGDAYPAKTRFTLSSTPITITGYKGLVTPVSDLVTIENGGVYADVPVLVTVPVTITPGSFAMGFYLRDDGSLEPMPLIDETPTSVTVATRHFSSFFIAQIAESAIPEDIGTGFRVGEDDFSVPNIGTYATPKGQCAGQSIAAMWYFLERKSAGAGDLYHHFEGGDPESTPDLWQDDRNAYRLTATLQEDLNWDNLLQNILWAFKDADQDRIQWLAFRYAMLVTGNPQFVGISQTGGGGHALVAYAATSSGLWVSDPNWPGKLRHIAWNEDLGEFDIYYSATDAVDSESAFDRVGFFGTSAFIEWSRVEGRFADAEMKVIGDTTFPVAGIVYGVLEPDGSTTWLPLVDETAFALGTDLMYRPDPTTARGQVTVYVNGTERGSWHDWVPFTPPLVEGRNVIGLYMQNFANKKFRAVDFVYVDVIVGAAPSLAPSEEPIPTTDDGIDCSKPPTSTIAKVKWSLKCNAIQTIQP